jgi:hypothetical protein
MADDKKEKPKKEKVNKAPKRSSPLGWLLMCIPLMLGLGFFYSPLFMLVIFMVPAWLALLIDQGEDRAMAVCITSGTVAGAMFFLADFWLQPVPFESVMTLVQRPQSWLLPLAGSACGAVIYYVLPMMAIEAVYLRNVAHKKQLEDMQKKLLEEWGPDVKG